MEARAAAMDELQESGAFEDALSDEDEIDRELNSMQRDGEVEAELETLKTEAGKGSVEEDPSVDAESEAETETADPEIEAELDELKDDDEE